MAIRKNVAGQKIAIFVTTYDSAFPVDSDGLNTTLNSWTGASGEVTGLNTANVTKIRLDGGASANATNSWSELSAANMPGVYVLELTQAETNADVIVVTINELTTISWSTFNRTLPSRFVFYTSPDWETKLLGPGQVIPGDTLAEIRDSLDSAVFPVLRSGQTVTELSGTGWLSWLFTKIRTYTDIPSTNAKFNPSRLLEMMRDSIREMWSDPAMSGAGRVYVRHSITLVSGQDHYVLPPGVGNIYGLYYQNTDGTQGTEIRPGNATTGSAGYWKEGNTLRFTPNTLYAGVVFTLLYTPNGDVKPFKATASVLAGDGTTITFPTTVTDGTLDTRANAYAGYIVRNLSSSSNNYEQEMAIASYDNTTRVATLVRPMSPVPGGTVVVEVVPAFSLLFSDVLAVHIARAIMSSDKNKAAFEMLTQRYREKARALRLQLTHQNQRSGFGYDGRTRDNTDYVGTSNWWWYYGGGAIS